MPPHAVSYNDGTPSACHLTATFQGSCVRYNYVWLDKKELISVYFSKYGIQV